MAYDPQKHHRRSIRLPEYDYSQPGAYFVTLVTWQRLNLFGEIKWGEMQLNPSGEAVKSCLQRLPGYFSIYLDEWVIMPNHMHMVFVIDGSRVLATANMEDNLSPDDAGILPHKPTGTQPGSIAAMVQNFKSVTTRKVNQVRKSPGAPVWQRNYYEHVLRDEAELLRVRKYIAENTQRWQEDQLYKE